MDQRGVTVRELSKTWELFVEGRDVDLTILRPEVAEAWRRCRAMNISPALKEAPPATLSYTASVERADLLRASEPVVSLIRDAGEGTDALVGVCDRQSHPLLVSAISRALDEAHRINAQPGFDWNESATGNNLYGTPLYLERPTQLDLGEHYVNTWQKWAGCSAPIFPPSCTTAVGALVVAAMGRINLERTLEVVSDSARLIGYSLYGIRAERRIHLDHVFEDWVRRYRDSAIIEVDCDGVVTRCTESCRSIFCLSGTLVGQPLTAWGQLGRIAQLLLTNRPIELPLDLPKISAAVSEPVIRNSALVGHIVALIQRKERPRGASQVWESEHTIRDIVGESESLRAAVRLAVKAATTDYPVLLIGETGTGKELFAHSIHDQSSRRENSFVPINSGTLSDELVVSELCGYEAGAFTGAARTTQRGLFDVADGGTLFVDELHDMGPKGQSLFLRFLETGRFLRVGGLRPVHAAVRIVAASNVSLSELTHTIRADLLQRLNCITIQIPALRERRGDIRAIGEKCLSQLGFMGSVDEEVWDRLATCDWPGNARELKNTLLRAVLASGGTRLEIRHLPQATSTNLPDRDVLTATRTEAIADALRETGGVVAEAARHLNVHRSTVYRRLKRLNLSPVAPRRAT